MGRSSHRVEDNADNADNFGRWLLYISVASLMLQGLIWLAVPDLFLIVDTELFNVLYILAVVESAIRIDHSSKKVIHLIVIAFVAGIISVRLAIEQLVYCHSLSEAEREEINCTDCVVDGRQCLLSQTGDTGANGVAFSIFVVCLIFARQLFLLVWWGHELRMHHEFLQSKN